MTAARATYSVRQATGPATQARLLVDPVTFSPRYDLDRVEGRFSRAGHPLYGEPISGVVLAAPGVQGGVAGGWAFLAMAGLGVGPAALVFGETNPVMVQGAVTADIPIVAGIDPAFFDEARTGDVVRVDPAARTVQLL
ncbi:MAG: aconitase X swivel domain-containing protein [Nocardioidaceae bacterium]